MRKGQTKGKEGLTKPVMTRIKNEKYAELSALAKQSKGETVSSLIRKILHDKPIKVFRHDESLDMVMEELAANRSEIRAIGVNINQMAKLFNTYPELEKKIFYAKNGYDRFLKLEIHIETLLEKVDKLAHKWLSE
jgi:hypothetical protein